MTAQDLAALIKGWPMATLLLFLAHRAETSGLVAYGADFPAMPPSDRWAALDWLEDRGLIECFPPNQRSNRPTSWAITRQGAAVAESLASRNT